MGLLGLTLGVAVGVALAAGSGVLVAVGVAVAVVVAVGVGVADPKAVDAVAVKLNMACGDDSAEEQAGPPNACTRTM